jgi:flagellar biosynthesis/type III secretory pathway protein FliH
MSSNSEQKELTPFEMVKSTMDEEHPADITVALRLPQAELKERIRDTVDDIRYALGERESLWTELEDKLNEREAERTEAYFNLGYEYGIATGRAEAFGKLSENADRETQKLAERLRNQVQSTRLPPSSIIAALLEIAWVFAHDLQTINHTDDA